MMMRAVTLLAVLSVATADFGTWYKDEESQHACFYRGDTAVTTHVAFNADAWPSTGAWKDKNVCGTCFVVSCDDTGSTFGIPGSTSCRGRSVISQLTNKCPECGSGGGSWGACTTCGGTHVDLWYSTFAALTGCDPTAGGCNPGVIPVKIGDPVPCPATTPKIFYRDAEAFFHIFQITGLGAGFADVELTNGNGVKFRQQKNDIGGVLLAIDGIPTSGLPATLAIKLSDKDGRTYTCNVPVGAKGSITPCDGGSGGSFTAGLGSSTTSTTTATTTAPPPAPATTDAPTNTNANTNTNTDAGQPATTTVIAESKATDESKAQDVTDCEVLRPVSPQTQEGVTKDYAAYKRCAKSKQSDWPPKAIGSFSPEYSQCGIGGEMPLQSVTCETGTVCCQTDSEYAQCVDPSDTKLTCIAQLVTG